MVMATLTLVSSCNKARKDTPDSEFYNWAIPSPYLTATNPSNTISTNEINRYLQEYNMEVEKRYDIEAGVQIPPTILPRKWENMGIDERIARMPGNRVEDVK